MADPILYYYSCRIGVSATLGNSNLRIIESSRLEKEPDWMGAG
jgi:hypothetical protein